MATGKLPFEVHCPHCNRNLELLKYACRSPSKSVATERIHRVADPQLAGYVVGCTCGHYTRFFNPDFAA